MNIYIPYTRLPSEYQEVEYIQSSGTQYIDTWYKPWKTTKVEIKFNCPSVSVSSWANFYWAFNTDSWSARRAYALQMQPSTPYVRASVYSNASSYGIQQSSINTISANTDYTVIHSNDNWYINWTLQWTFTSVPTYTVPYNMFLFSGNNWWSSIVPVSMKLYYFKITDSNTLTRDLVPCYRKSDNVIWLYDLVNDQFYTNSWTGTFSKGNDVTMSVLKNIYIGEYGWKPWSNTVAYFPFVDDALDHSWNWTVLTYWTATKQNLWYSVTQRAWFLNSNVKTVLWWVKISSTTYPYDMFVMWNDNAGAAYYFYHVQSNFNQKFLCFYNSSYNASTASYTMDLNKWYLIGTTIDTENNKVCWYANWQKVFEYNWTWYNFGSDINFFHEQRDWWWWYWSNVCYLSECIAESKARTDSEFADYYNQTKSNYWL